MEKILVVLDHAQGKIRPACWEALAMGQRVGQATGSEVHAVILGHDIAPLGEDAARYDLASVILIDDPRLGEYDPDAHTSALKGCVQEELPQLLVLAHSYQNIDLAPKLAAALGSALVTDCIDFRKDEAGLVFTRQMFRNKINADVRMKSAPPWIVTLQAGAFNSDDRKAGLAQTRSCSVDLSGVPQRRRQLEAIAAGKGKVDLTKAEVIVGVGRGIKKQENLAIIQELADALGAEIGASRPVVDNDWLERERQIGSSGQNVSPKLYIACGISGAIQHVVGMKSAQCIVAINTDPNAPIFNIANYGIVGNLLEIVPMLTKKLRESSQA